MSSLAGNRRGIAAMTLGMTLFVINDALIKFVSESLPTGQIIFLRGLLAVAITLVVAAATGVLHRARAAMAPAVAVRALIDAVATFVYLIALFNMPIGNITAINLASPLILTALAVVVLGEQVGWRRWSAVAVGFLGVLLVVQPRTEGFTAFSILALVATGLHAARDMVTRRIDPAVPSLIVTLSTAAAVTVCALAVSLVEGWQPVGTLHAGLLVAASLFLTGGYFLAIDAMRHGEMSVVAPFRYTGLLVALASGYLVWGEIPNALASAGIVLLISSGLYILQRERIRRAAAPAD